MFSSVKNILILNTGIFQFQLVLSKHDLNKVIFKYDAIITNSEIIIIT